MSNFVHKAIVDDLDLMVRVRFEYSLFQCLNRAGSVAEARNCLEATSELIGARAADSSMPDERTCAKYYAEIKYRLGLGEMIHYSLANAQILFLESIFLFRKLGDTNGIARSEEGLANVHGHLGDIKSECEALLRAKSVYDTSRNWGKSIQCIGGLAVLPIKDVDRKELEGTFFSSDYDVNQALLARGTYSARSQRRTTPFTSPTLQNLRVVTRRCWPRDWQPSWRKL